MIQLTDTVSRHDDTFGRTIQDMDIVIQTGRSELHTFNTVGARVWELIDGHRTVADIVAVIVADYDVAQATAETDVLELLGRLQEKQLITV